MYILFTFADPPSNLLILVFDVAVGLLISFFVDQATIPIFCGAEGRCK